LAVVVIIFVIEDLVVIEFVVVFVELIIIKVIVIIIEVVAVIIVFGGVIFALVEVILVFVLVFTLFEVGFEQGLPSMVGLFDELDILHEGDGGAASGQQNAEHF
jgi:hypothetical protein